ncbi:hypothetical protein TREAZ_2403 [Leadbettera azotonutricia ZAS-9]|uniref:Uncharacterized protein n=1 Tax=Leadbettera azotonutricia (strain ATCC BAA-888 / DSM 13862 / ZAS-9) TaxID=545695 RepID=F5YGB5_LEAAZ|nr:hypothetical protein TREAZ_2403 [Leadbettera azotonutricia ZAS-9]
MLDSLNENMRMVTGKEEPLKKRWSPEMPAISLKIIYRKRRSGILRYLSRTSNSANGILVSTTGKAME